MTTYNQTVIPCVAATLERFRMLPADPRLGVAVSGGADSVFLLHALHHLKLATTILHINHHLRGAESDADETFVRALAADLNLPILVHLGPPPGTGNLEQETRRIRYDFFKTVLTDDICNAIATGHTLDDQAETVLYRFLRGSGTAGLSGIRPVTTNGIIRPLIELRRESIRTWLRERSIPWREDQSNADPAFLRNRIRLLHMPALVASLNPALPEVLASTGTWARDEEDYWTAELDRLEPFHLSFGQGRNPETVFLQTAPLLALAPAIQRRLLRRAIERIRGNLRSIDFSHVESIRCLTLSSQGSGRIQIPGIDVYRSFDWLRLSPPGYDARIERDFEKPLAIPGLTQDAERHLAIELKLVSTPSVYNDDVGELDRDKCSDSLVLRNWRPGDHYQAQGRTSADKIKTLFQEFRIPLWERRGWPVIVQGKSILWARKFGVASEFAAGPNSRQVLRILEVPFIEVPFVEVPRIFK